MKKFFGRKNELNLLNQYVMEGGAKFVTIYGRRRVGKSRLIQEFSTDKQMYDFVGLALGPNITAQTQRDEFQRRLTAYGVPLLSKKEKVVLFLDEISWLAHGDPTFLPKLKTAWDTQFKQHNVMLIVCGSVSSWIENIL